MLTDKLLHTPQLDIAIARKDDFDLPAHTPATPPATTKTKRKRERAIAGLLFEELIGLPVDIRHRAGGKPFLFGSELEISISHSAHYVAVAVSNALPIGIDIEQPMPRIAELAPRFLHPEEYSLASQSTDPLRAYTMMWCAKEAVYKRFGDVSEFHMLEHIHIIALPDSLPGQVHVRCTHPAVSPTLRVQCEPYRDALLAYTLPDVD